MREYQSKKENKRKKWIVLKRNCTKQSLKYKDKKKLKIRNKHFLKISFS